MSWIAMTHIADNPSENLFDHPASSEEFQEHGHTRSLGGLALKAVIVAAMTFSAYQLLVAGFSPF